MREKYDVAIIGAGPAGLTAGIYAGRAGKTAAIFEREMIGGQIAFTDSIDNFPATPGINGAEYAMKLQGQAESFGAKIINQQVTAITPPASQGEPFTIVTAAGEYESLTVILATGLSHRRMEVPGEDKLIGRGISFCAVCDGMFFRGREVAVYGGGNTAVEDAIYLTNVASKVTIIHRRDRFRADQHLVDELKSKPNVEFMMEHTISEVQGDSVLEQLILQDVNSGEQSSLPANGLFVAIGQIPNGSIFANLVATDSAGYYEIDESCAAETPGVFAAGDGRNKEVRQLTTAVADGAVAATKACKYIDKLAGKEYI